MKKIFIGLALIFAQVSLTTQAEARGGDGVAGAIIGLGAGIIIGSGLNDRNDRHGGYYDGGYYDGGYGGRSRSEWVCYAHNWRGESFRARGFSRRHAADRVIEKCYAYSRKCFIDSCEPRY